MNGLGFIANKTNIVYPQLTRKYSFLNNISNSFTCIQGPLYNISNCPNMTLQNLYLTALNFYNARNSVTGRNMILTNTVITTKTAVAPSGYVQATTGVDGNDGTITIGIDDPTYILAMREMKHVLANQNVNQTTTKKYNSTLTL